VTLIGNKFINYKCLQMRSDLLVEVAQLRSLARAVVGVLEHHVAHVPLSQLAPEQGHVQSRPTCFVLGTSYTKCHLPHVWCGARPA